jgi:hypothetical protein
MEVEQKSHLGVGGLFQGADLSPPSPVHQDIEATKAFRRLVDDLSIAGSVSHVQHDRKEPIGVGTLEIVEAADATAGTYDDIALAQHLFGKRTSKT